MRQGIVFAISALLLALLFGGVVVSRSGGSAASRPSPPTPVQSAASSAPAVSTPRAASPRPLRKPGATVALLRSESTMRVLGVMGRWESEQAEATLRDMGLGVRVLGDADVIDRLPSGFRVLVVADSRCVPSTATAAVKAFVAGGGRLLATSMASYRDQENRRVGHVNNFQWAELFAVDFRRWVSGGTRCDALSLGDVLARDVAVALGRKDPLARVSLGRNMAMLVAARSGARVLATWLEADGRTPTTDAGATAAAIVESSDGRVIYVGENILAPELTRSPQVRALVLALLRRLDPSLVPARLPVGSVRVAQAFRPPPEPATAPDADGPFLRVGIHDGMAAVGVASRSGLRLEGTSSGGSSSSPLAMDVPAGQASEVRVVAPVLARPYLAVYDAGGNLQARVASPLLVKPVDPRGTTLLMDLRDNGTCRARAHRGSLELSIRGDRVAVTGVMGIDAYTAGVVPNEVPGTYPREALAAMAVIARTFALSRRGYHRAQGYDVCSTVHCQVYGGATTEWESTNRAVTETAGEVIRWGSELADATFHAVCGGVGEDVERVWKQGPNPYLRAHADGPQDPGDLSGEKAFRAFIDHPPDAFCSASPRFRWTETYTRAELQTLFDRSLPVTLKGGFRGLGALQTVRVASRSPHGRVQVLEIVGSGGTYRVEKDAIRWLWSGGLIGLGGLQSTLFYIDAVAGPHPSLVFHGGGWGHGVGMCQDGAQGMAARGHDHRAIIRHYYPGTTVTPRRGDSTTSRPGSLLPTGDRTTGPAAVPSR